MKAELVRIGNSQGIRIPKPIIEQCGFVGSVDIMVQGDALIVRPVCNVREGWDERFRGMAAHRDDHLMDKDPPATRWDETEWQW
jgi:antitoxin MazE